MIARLHFTVCVCPCVCVCVAVAPQERQAFLEPYKQFKLFRDANNGLSLEEFADAREVVSDLSAEYEACEHADYVSVTRTHHAHALTHVRWCLT